MIDPTLIAAAIQSEAALVRGAGDAYDHMIIALKHAALDDHVAAQASFDSALALEPHNPSIIVGLAKWHRQRGDFREAVLACDAAIRLAPDYADAWLERATVLGSGGSSRAARESYARAAQLDPGSAVAFAGVASQAGRDGDRAGAREAAERALALDPLNLVAAAALGNVLSAEGDAVSAQQLLTPLVASTPSSHSRSIAATALATAYERLGDYSAAYDNYALAKQDFQAAYLAQASVDNGHTAFVDAIAAAMRAIPSENFAASADRSANRRPRHIFLIGYPRSGTTLVENVLASLAGVAASEEWPTFEQADQHYLAGDAAAIAIGLRDFVALDDAALAQLRTAYWDRVATSGVPLDATAYVDMDPLKATRLPFIARMFPEARILLMRRDPRDVVWSCFKTNFAMTSNTLEYTSLKRAARHYDAMMRLTDLALGKLPLSVFEIDYQRLTRDFDATTREICAFSKLAWSENVRRFDKTADQRGVGTASAAQVRKGLYDGSGQWRPYAQWLDPVLSILEPWIARFGHGD